MRAWIIGVLAACLLCVGYMAHAAVMPGLYEASVSVPDQSAATRNQGLQQALAAVLVKITGDRAAPRLPVLADILKDPSQFLQQYRYQQTSTDGSAASTPTVMFDLTRTGTPAIAPTNLMLWAKFDPEVLDHAVRAANEPLWGQERPVTLVWLAIENGSSKTILSATNDAAVMQAMISAADERGIALIFPRMDAQDQRSIGFPDISSDDVARIQQASQVYKADAILVGTVYMTTPGQYAARWQLTASAGSQAWTATPDALTAVTTGGIQTTADHFAQWYAVAAGATGISGVSVSVTGIYNVDAYAKVLAYLSGLTAVKGVQVTRVDYGTVYFSLDTHGSLENLQQAALLGGLLKPVTQAPGIVTGAALVPAAALKFKYMP
ncbi:MAG TPA: DUF2066 domain-containing protein [Gammaproteobacteria bacterium]|nr:DUF2066 domain-containing protein [Gammaproteobacteria bacterium]